MGYILLSSYIVFKKGHYCFIFSKHYCYTLFIFRHGKQSYDTERNTNQSAKSGLPIFDTAELAKLTARLSSALPPGAKKTTAPSSTLNNGMTSIEVPTCPPPGQRNIVCIKVHKAASTTAVAILERYGYKHNLTLAVRGEVKYGPHILSSSQRFRRSMVYQYQRTYNMLTNHVRYNRDEMDIVVPNATYLSILRHPVKHFESAFSYFIVAKHLDLDREDPIKAFFEKPEEYMSRKFYFWFQIQNGQIFDLGLDHVDHTGPNVTRLINRLAKEFDLIMIADYFDESLLLLRKQLCLDWKDILYIPDNFRKSSQKLSISKELREKIEVWNWADMTLYRFFNQTFWNKIKDYGPTFQQDLVYFRQLLEDTRGDCTTGKVVKKPRDGHGVRTIELRENATQFCHNLMLGDTDYTRMFRDRQKETLYNRPQFWNRH